MSKQWIYASTVSGNYRIGTFPISFSSVPRCFITIPGEPNDTGIYNPIWNDGQTTATKVQVNMHQSTGASPMVLAIGR